jgi:hypothetical protein
MKYATTVLLIALCGIVNSWSAEKESFVPRPVDSSDFGALTSQSPFSRSISLSDSLILTGMAMVDQIQMATLLNKETKETYIVSHQLNAQGWKMVELMKDEDLEKVSAKVSIDGGEVVTVRYAEWFLKRGEALPGRGVMEVGPGSGPREGSDGAKGKNDGGSFDIREKMMQLSEEQRSKMFQKMMKLRQENPDISSDQRREIMTEMLSQMEKK